MFQSSTSSNSHNIHKPAAVPADPMMSFTMANHLPVRGPAKCTIGIVPARAGRVVPGVFGLR